MLGWQFRHHLLSPLHYALRGVPREVHFPYRVACGVFPGSPAFAKSFHDRGGDGAEIRLID